MYRKFLIALLAALITAASAALTDNKISAVEQVNIILALGTAASVFLVKNSVNFPVAKFAVAAVLAAANYVVTSIGDCQSVVAFHCLNAGNWIQIGVSVAGAGLVYLVPNTEG